jgi:uncharacterized lipoprotein
MIKQNRTKLQFLLGAILMLTFAACNNSSENKEATKDTMTKTETPPPAPAVRDSADTMEVTPGKVAPGNDVKPQ